MTSSKPPESPVRASPPRDWPHLALFDRVRTTLLALPAHFRTEIRISGISATDLFTLNSAIGAAIEEQVVEALNGARRSWDPNAEYAVYSFERQPQTFPDVRLQPRSERKPKPLMGIELKGWYLLAKEGEPSFRYMVTPQVCNPQDLIVVVPWALDQVVSGSPKLFQPFIEYARYVAEYRNYHWQHLMQPDAAESGAKGVVSSSSCSPYPAKGENINDRPLADAGGNFGRLARSGVMDDYLKEIEQQTLCGIEARYWRRFFKVFQQRRSSEAVEGALDALARQVSVAASGGAASVEALRQKLLEIAEIIQR